MADYISDFSLYRGAGKTLIGFIFFFFAIHTILFFRSMLSKAPLSRTSDALERKLEKIIEREVIPSTLVMAVVITSRGISMEGVIVVILILLGYVILLIGELLDRPDLKIIGRVGYGVSTIMMAGFAMFHYNKFGAVINSSP